MLQYFFLPHFRDLNTAEVKISSRSRRSSRQLIMARSPAEMLAEAANNQSKQQWTGALSMLDSAKRHGHMRASRGRPPHRIRGRAVPVRPRDMTASRSSSPAPPNDPPALPSRARPRAVALGGRSRDAIVAPGPQQASRGRPGGETRRAGVRVVDLHARSLSIARQRGRTRAIRPIGFARAPCAGRAAENAAADPVKSSGGGVEHARGAVADRLIERPCRARAACARQSCG
jgi:hypothetical protein